MNAVDRLSLNEPVPVPRKRLALWEIRHACHDGNLVPGLHPFAAVLVGPRGGCVDLGRKIIRQEKDMHELPRELGFQVRNFHRYGETICRDREPEFRMPLRRLDARGSRAAPVQCTPGRGMQPALERALAGGDYDARSEMEPGYSLAITAIDAVDH